MTREDILLGMTPCVGHEKGVLAGQAGGWVIHYWPYDGHYCVYHAEATSTSMKAVYATLGARSNRHTGCGMLGSTKVQYCVKVPLGVPVADYIHNIERAAWKPVWDALGWKEKDSDYTR